MKMTTICYEQDYHLINNETEQIIFNFRAPPPSPTGSSRRTSSVTNEGVLSSFLETTLRVPDLILPNKIFPRQKPFKEIPIIDFQKLMNSSDDVFVESLRRSFEEIGCYQVINHGIHPELVKTVVRRVARVFRMSPEKKRMAVRSSEMGFGFEEVSGDQDEFLGEISEEFVWGKSFDLKVKMEGILPIKYSKFSAKMERLERAIEKVAKDMMLIMMKNNEDGNLISTNQTINDSICHIYKHPRQVAVDRCISALRYDVIRMMINGPDYSHALSLHVCDGSSEFQVYSKKGWTSFVPLENALIVTSGDQFQAWSGGRYKHVIAKPIYTNKSEDCISMSFHFSAPGINANLDDDGPQAVKARTISLRDQALFAIFLTIASQFLLHFYNMLNRS